ncbi:hypothetical protein [Paraherbaspirillum soli]|uniref:ParA family protein n=1 Tax=Paraherbaspirillum soli TaxID=631222 RepID=A0ABW0MBU7_9BURK
MIITIFSEDDNAKRSMLAVNLAALRALDHHKVLLIDATAPEYSLNWSTQFNAAGVKSRFVVHGTENLESELESPDSYYRTHYREIIIDADGIDARSTDSALLATDVLVVPIRSGQNDVRNRENLVQRIETSRLFNSALRVLVVEVQAISAFGDAATQAFNSAKVFAQKVLTATLAKTVIHEWIDDRRSFEQGLSVFESEPGNQHAAAEIKDLYQEISRIRDLPVEAAANNLAIMHAIQRRIHE